MQTRIMLPEAKLKKNRKRKKKKKKKKRDSALRVSFRKLLPCAIQSIHRVTGRNAMIVAGRWLSSSSSFSACCFKRHALHLVTFTCFTAVQPFFARSSSLSAGKEEEEEEEEKSGNND